MSRIGLTQRVEVVEEYEERRNCLDQRWGPLLQSFDLVPVPLFNRTEDIEEYVERVALDGVVVTGGNDFAHLEDGTNAAPERDRFERSLLDVAIDRDLPVLGVCRGLQLVNLHFGGSITRIDDHVAREHDVEIDGDEVPFDDPPERARVNSYHNYGVRDDELGDDLAVVGQAPDGSFEWIEHERYPITGIMWHPERDGSPTELDRRIIAHRLPTKSV